MKLVVQDACILIDLIDGSLLEAWNSLGIETVVTSLVMAEVNSPEQKKKLHASTFWKKLTIKDLEPVEIGEVLHLQSEIGAGLSLADCSALYTAITMGAVLLSGDGVLRKKAKGRVDVKGLLWVLDELVAKRVITPRNAAERLQSLIEAGSRLPPHECATRLEKWKSNSRFILKK